MIYFVYSHVFQQYMIITKEFRKFYEMFLTIRSNIKTNISRGGRKCRLQQVYMEKGLIIAVDNGVHSLKAYCQSEKFNESANFLHSPGVFFPSQTI